MKSVEKRQIASGRMRLNVLILAAFMLISILAGCGGDTSGTDGKPPADLADMDYATFKAKVINHQIEAVVIYPEDSVMTVVTTDSGQIYKVAYDEAVIDTGTVRLQELLQENGVPFTVETPPGNGS